MASQTRRIRSICEGEGAVLGGSHSMPISLRKSKKMEMHEILLESLGLRSLGFDVAVTGSSDVLQAGNAQFL